jgi:hypothetical protein
MIALLPGGRSPEDITGGLRLRDIWKFLMSEEIEHLGLSVSLRSQPSVYVGDPTPSGSCPI